MPQHEDRAVEVRAFSRAEASHLASLKAEAKWPGWAVMFTDPEPVRDVARDDTDGLWRVAVLMYRRNVQ